MLAGVSGCAGGCVWHRSESQFDIDFVTISGDAGKPGQLACGVTVTRSRVSIAVTTALARIEITNDQWNEVHQQPEYGTVTGEPVVCVRAQDPYWTGTRTYRPIAVSWYEAAQFVNWLNTSTGHQAAYKFTGTQGTARLHDGHLEPGRSRQWHEPLPPQGRVVLHAHGR